MKKKMLIVIFMLFLVAFIVNVVVVNAFETQSEASNHSELFLTSQIPEIDDYRRARSAAFSSEKNEFVEVKRRMDDLKNTKELDEAAIVVQDGIITKRDVEKFKIVNDIIGKFVLVEKSDRLKDDKLKYDIIELVRGIVLKTEVERTVDMPSQEEISYDIEKEKYLFELKEIFSESNIPFLIDVNLYENLPEYFKNEIDKDNIKIYPDIDIVDSTF